MNYFVIGLPRSRTAWLSVFLSQSGNYCHHDGLNGCRTIDAYRQKIGTHGDSSTGLMMFDVDKLFPGAPIVIIEKNDIELQSCISWCNNTYQVDSRDHIKRLNGLMATIKGLRIKQRDINQMLPEIWAHLIGTRWKDEYANLTDFNIQSDPYAIDYLSALEIMHEAI